MSKEIKIYLDNNASTAIDPRVLEVVIEDLKESTGNPSSIHSFGKHSRLKLSKARKTIAEYLGVRTQEIIFTSGGTEGANYLLRGLFACHHGGHLITSNIEHGCIYETAKLLELNGSHVTFLSPNLSGVIDINHVYQAITPKTRMISLMAANNETGVKTDIEAIAQIAKEKNIFFLVDGVALLGKENFTMHDGVSAMFFSGHKIHAPKGIGFIVLRSKAALQPLLIGGEQEFGKRAGSENLSGIVGLAEAVRLLDIELPAAEEKMRELRDFLETSLIERLQGVKVNGAGPRVSNTSNICFSGVEGETLLAALDMEGIAVSHGSACSSGALEPSRVLLNMGIPRFEAASSLRISLSRMTTKEEIDRFIETVIKLVSRLRGY